MKTLQARVILTTGEAGNYTYRDLLDIPEDQRHEIIHGHLIALASPLFNHQEVILRLIRQIDPFFADKKCHLVLAPMDVLLTEPEEKPEEARIVLQPDLFVLCDGEKNKQRYILGAPDWVIEVLSPSSATRDLVTKARLYEKYGCKEYWVVNPADKSVAIWRREEPTQDFASTDLNPAEGKTEHPLFPGLVVSWDAIFEGLDEE